MKRTLLAVAVLFSAPAFAQQVAQQTSCSLGVDGGTGASTLTCPAFALNYQPMTVVCEAITQGSHLVGTTNVLVSSDGVHFADAGQVFAFNQDVSATSTGLFAIAPTDPWIEAEVVTGITTNDGGTAGGAVITCQQAVIQAQTIHASKPKVAPKK